MAIAALVCGILGLVGAWIPVVRYIAWLLPIAAIVLGILGRKEAKRTGQSSGMATAGIVLGIIALVFTALLIVLLIAGIGALASLATGFF